MPNANSARELSLWVWPLSQFQGKSVHVVRQMLTRNLQWEWDKFNWTYLEICFLEETPCLVLSTDRFQIIYYLECLVRYLHSCDWRAQILVRIIEQLSTCLWHLRRQKFSIQDPTSSSLYFVLNPCCALGLLQSVRTNLRVCCCFAHNGWRTWCKQFAHLTGICNSVAQLCSQQQSQVLSCTKNWCHPVEICVRVVDSIWPAKEQQSCTTAAALTFFSNELTSWRLCSSTTDRKLCHTQIFWAGSICRQIFTWSKSYTKKIHNEHTCLLSKHKHLCKIRVQIFACPRVMRAFWHCQVHLET